MADRQLSLEICKPDETTARLVMAWRNHKTALANSFHQQPKQWPAFGEEFRNDYFTEPALSPLFGLDQGRPVGFVRFRTVPSPTAAWKRCRDISVMIDPDRQGRGLGPELIDQACCRAADLGIDEILAEVLVGNQASLKAFQKAGFEPLDQADHLVADTGQVFPVIRLMRRLNDEFIDREGVFVIAEAGSNWRMGSPKRDLAMAKSLIEAAADAKADAVKFQTFSADSVYVANAGESDYLARAGYKESIRDIFSDLAMPHEMIPQLADHCRRCGLEFMSAAFSPADFAAVDPHVAVHKIASYEISHLRLLELAARSGKPLVLSTGAAEGADIAWAVDTFRKSGGEKLCLMQCTAKYPAPLDSMNLAAIPWMKARFKTAVGLSDHSRHPTLAPVAAVALGARVIEKHFTLSNRLPGPDHSFALTPPELAEMVAAVRQAELMSGQGGKEILPVEQELAAFARRGLQAVRDIKAGQVLREGDNYNILRPGRQKPGLHPKYIDRCEGKAAAKDIPAGQGLEVGDWID